MIPALIGNVGSWFASATADTELGVAGTSIVTVFSENVKAFFVTNTPAIAGIVILSVVVMLAIRMLRRVAK